MHRSFPYTTRIVISVMILTLFCFVVSLAAWQTNWKIQGYVTLGGSPLSRASVEATNLDTGETKRTFTDSYGYYVFTNLERGRYSIKVESSGFASKKIKQVQIGPNLPDRFDIKMGTGGKVDEPSKKHEKKTTKPTTLPIIIVTPTPSSGSGQTDVETPPPSVNPSPSPKPPQLESNLDQILKNLPLGNIAFNTPEEMRLGETINIQLALSPTKLAEELKKGIEESGKVETAQIKISEWMEARLVGDAFQITPITPERQLVSRTEDTFWRWEVRAKQPGKQRLNLSMNVILEEKGREAVRNLRTFKRDIVIEVTFPDRIKGFVEDNWQWLWATLVVPIAAWLWRRYSSRKRQSDSTSE